MAVYKATYCYPYLNTLDIRVSATDPAAIPAEYLSCKIDTSNTPVTGYSIRLLDDDNKVIFPVQSSHISPVSELQALPIYEETGINSGLNGTELRVPFFQSNDTKRLASYNAIYYKPRYGVDHVLMDAQSANVLNYSMTMYEQVGVNENNTNSLWLWAGSEQTGDQYLHFDWATARTRDPNVVFNKIVLDGETIMIGETVLILVGAKNPSEIVPGDKPRADQQLSGLWIVSERYSDSEQAYELILKPIKGFNSNYPNTGRLNNNEMAVLKKGELLHNCVFKYLSVSNITDSGYFRPVASTDLWCDYAGNPISNLQVDGRFFKWEITLYQGNVTLASSSAVPQYINYSNIYAEWMDITMSSGTILGSCSERIQIANMEPAAGVDDQVVLPAATSGDIVLQGKYMDLTYIPAGSTIDTFHGTRVYVKNYDASYGHVYPMQGNLKAMSVGQATHCQFFKHSNNSDEVLATDKVTWGFNRPWSIIYNEDISSSFLVIDDTDSGTSIPSNMHDGDLFLITMNDQYAYKSGVYEYVYNTTGISYTPQGGSEHVYHHFCRRAASYSDWASYIGKVVLCERGEYGGSNVESLAPAGTYTLWNPLNTITGDSNLYFTQERPIVLFSQLLSQTVDTMTASTMGSGETWSVTATAASFGGEIPSKGDLVYFIPSRGFAEVTNVTFDSGDDWIIGFQRRNDLSSLTDGDYIYVTKGGKMAGSVYKITVSGGTSLATATMELSTAVILKNSLTQTYITPFINMEEGMMLKLNGGQTVTYVRGASGTVHSPKYMMIGQGSGNTEVNVDTLTSQWIKVLAYNKTVSCVRHNQLECTSNGIEQRPDGSQGLACSGGPDSGYPWTYEVRSHFTKSNENSFCAFEQSYVRLYKNGESYTGLSLGNAYDFDVLENFNNVVYEDMYVRDNDQSEIAEDRFGFIYANDGSTLTTRSVRFSAEYKQFNQISWESYRWLLLDDEGNILQDTGNKYTGTIDVTFFGLGNETNGVKVYYAVLFITDDQNNTLRYIIKLNVGQVLQSTAALPFTAEFDCQTHSVLLNYEDAGVVSPVYLQTQDYTYQVYDSSNNTSESPWDGGLLYDDNRMYVTAKYNNLNRLVDYSAGSKLLDDQGHNDGVDLAHSNSIYYGVPYNVATPRDASNVSVEYGSILHLDNEEDGQFYFDTQIKLDDNYCGEIFAVDVEKAANAAGAINPVTDLNNTKPTYFNNYVRFGLRLPNNFTGIGTGTKHKDVLNANRTSIELFLLTDTSHSRTYNFKASSGSNPYRWDDRGEALPTEVTSGNIKYYIQPERYAGDMELWTGDVEFFELSGMPYNSSANYDTYQFYLKQYGGNYFGFFGKFLGNLNLLSANDCKNIADTDLYVNTSIKFKSDTTLNPSQNPTKLSMNAPSYWVDDRKKIAIIPDYGNNFYGIAATNYQYFNVYQQSITSGMLSWPTDGDNERSSYWNEGTSGASLLDNYSSTWNKIIPTSDLTICPMVPMPRHPSLLSDKDFRITAKIYNIEELYDQVRDNTLTANYSFRSIDNTYIISFNYTNGDALTVPLAQFYLKVIMNE